MFMLAQAGSQRATKRLRGRRYVALRRVASAVACRAAACRAGPKRANQHPRLTRPRKVYIMPRAPLRQPRRFTAVDSALQRRFWGGG